MSQTNAIAMFKQMRVETGDKAWLAGKVDVA